jgi:hypothetical protein
VELAQRVPTNLIGATVESQHDDYLLLERPAAKPRAAKGTRKPRTTPPVRKTQPAVSFDTTAMETARG